MQIGAKTCKKRVCNVYTNWAYILHTTIGGWVGWLAETYCTRTNFARAETGSHLKKERERVNGRSHTQKKYTAELKREGVTKKTPLGRLLCNKSHGRNLDVREEEEEEEEDTSPFFVTPSFLLLLLLGLHDMGEYMNLETNYPFLFPLSLHKKNFFIFQSLEETAPSFFGGVAEKKYLGTHLRP